MYEPYMEHSGIKGMHWGVRRYQNPDGSLTPAGRSRYGVGPARKFKTTVGSAIKSAKRGASNAVSRVRKIAASRKKKNIEKLVRSGDVEKIAKKASKLTNSQLDDAIARANKISDAKTKAGPQKDMIDKIERVIGTMDKGAKMAKNIYDYKSAKVKYRKDKYYLYNLMSGDSDSKSKSEKKKRGDKSDKKDEKNESVIKTLDTLNPLKDARDKSNKKVEEAIEKAKKPEKAEKAEKPKKPSYGERVAAKRQTFTEQLAKNARVRDEEKYIDDLIKRAKKNRRRQQIWGL